ncbi:TonB-dependent receptor [uncultured Bacteroides sp.]|uniref:SusC/RagA family TonB-linked outer membrane protein n=1 Tax=uncultured Bacteroides sp. TaxID=162156 RepID=UPI002AA722D7|nr:TonB-dependent receptor [uncultured Bacteroides sp.]
MKRKLMLLLTCLFVGVGLVTAQTQRVTGVVTSEEDGLPVVGASILVKGTSVGTITDVDGNFTLSNIPGSAKTLQISYIGMQTQEVAIKPTLKVVLKSDAKVLDEVIIVAYGQQKKSSFTGSAGVVNSEKLSERVVSNITNAVSGQIAGVQSVNNSGQPGSSATIRIRGIGSMSSSNAPLYVVDGVPYDSDISAINPQDIESMTVLKDASANAIYGARGANGVILITTKTGKSGSAKVTFDAKWGSNSRMIPQYDVIGTGEYYETQYKALYNSKAYAGSSSSVAFDYADKTLLDSKNGGLGYLVYTVPTGEKLIGTNFKLNPNAKLGYSDGTYYYKPDDWYNEIFGSNLRQEYNASVAGGSEKINYYTSVGYLDDSGLIANSAFKRYTGRAKVDYQAKKWLKVGTNLAYAYTDSESPESQSADSWGSSGNLFYVVNTLAPIYPMYVRNEDGSIAHDSTTGYKVYDSGNNTNFSRPSLTGNAARDIDLNRQHNYIDNLSGKWYAQINPIEGLTLTANIAVNVQNQRLNELFSRFGSSSASDGIAYVESDRSFGVNNQYLASYTKAIAEKHNIDLLIGYEQYRYKDQVLYGQNTNLYDPFIGELNNATGTSQKVAKSYTDNYMTEGILSRVQYNYDGKYFFSGSFRRDASSRFAEGHRWGNFGSVGAAWLITQEKFMKPTNDWLNSLKFKISWGQQGNDGLLRTVNGVSRDNWYAYKDQYNVSYNEQTQQYSLVLAYKGKEDITWETSYSFNTGFDFELFNNKLNGSIEYFSRKTTNLLYNKPVPLSSGISTGYVPTNVGSIINKGIELDLNSTIVKNNDLEWDLNFNLTHYSNKILSLDADLEAAGGQKGSYYIYRVGGSLYNSYLKTYVGVDPDTGEALYYVDPDNGDYTKTANYEDAKQADQGSTLPTVYGGFGTTLRFHGFDLSAQIAYQLGGKYYDGAYQTYMHNGGDGMQGTNWSTDIRNAWTPTNRYTNVPRLDASDPCYQYDSSRFLVSSDYLSLNNITLGYTLSKRSLNALGISNLRLYVTADNVALLSARKGLDSRQSLGVGSSTAGSGAETTSSYSAMRTIAGGITVTF